MSRKAILEGGKRDEILKAALELFLKNGYEGTSVRMILEQVHGEVGMFYHYFQSKQEVFDKAFELFMKQQSEQISQVLEHQSVELSLEEKIKKIIRCYDSGMQTYRNVFTEEVHWTVSSALHDMTLCAMEPALTRMMHDMVLTFKENDSCKEEWLIRFLLNGIGGVLHDSTFEEQSIEERTGFIMKIIKKIADREGDDLG